MIDYIPPDIPPAIIVFADEYLCNRSLKASNQQTETAYKKIPIEHQAKYKAEIEQAIKDEIPKSKTLIDNLPNELRTEKNPHVKQTIVDYGVPEAIFNLYMRLITITDKYVSIKQTLPATDDFESLKLILDFYLKDNKINTSEIDKFLNYADKAQSRLNQIHY